jgi:phage N-6-adenine-methyltransferase
MAIRRRSLGRRRRDGARRVQGAEPSSAGRPARRATRGRQPTPWDFFTLLHERFSFTLDAAALPHNAKCERFFTPEDDGLAQSWAGERVWCNPPYSDIEPWVAKAWSEKRAHLVVMLLPANRTEQGWWQRQVEPYRDSYAQGVRVEFLPGRLRFIKHGHDRVEPNQRPPFGCCLLVWGQRVR